MKKLDKGIQILIATVLTTAIALYLSFLFLLPKIINSPKNIAKIEKLLLNKTGFGIKINGFKYVSNPNLTFDLKAKRISATSGKKEILIDIDKLDYHAFILNKIHGKLSADCIFADINLLKKYFSTDKKDKKKLDFSNFPATNIKSGMIVLNESTYANINGIVSEKKHGKIITKIRSEVFNPYTKHPVKVGESGFIIFDDNLGFENFSIKAGSSEVFLTGSGGNLNIKGEKLPVKELEEGFLYIYKLRNPDKKNFIENFANFKGTLDIDLKIEKGNLSGKCITHNLGADFSTLKIPVFLPKTVFHFKDKTIKAETQGTFGGEPVTTDVAITGVATDKLEVLGTVESTFTNNLVKKYYPDVEIEGTTPAKVTYHTHNNGIVDVYYQLTVPKGSNLLSVWGNLDNTDKTRIITMHTKKQGQPMKIEELEYSAEEQKQCQKLLLGEGLIDKINGKYTLYNLNIKTNGQVSVNYIKSFLRDYIKNGTFDADIKLDFIKRNILGYMNLYNISNDQNLILKNTNLNVNKDEITLHTNGELYSSPIIASATVENKFENNKITVKSIDMHLNSLFLKSGELKTDEFRKNKKTTAITHKKRPDIEIEQGRVVVDRLYGNKFDVRNVNFQGSLRNNIANFIIPKADYAKGVLSAKGIYNIKNHSSDIHFLASDIDSNEVATYMFKLPNQIKGEAYATLHVISKNKFNDVKAKATFAISDGYLPQIGKQEFVLRKAKNNKKPSKIARIMGTGVKFSLSKITNIDFSRPNVFYSNLYGSFDMDNEYVKNVRIFSKSDHLGLYIEGDYDIETENGNINVFGKRSKIEAKQIRIFKIPLNLIYRIVFRPEHTAEYYENKVKLIPPIKDSMIDDIAIFRISIKGNFNKSEKRKVELKDIR